MQVRAGRQPGRSDVADHLPLAHAHPRLDAAREAGHVAVGGFVAVGVAQLHVFAVAGFPAGLFHDAVARRVDRRAVGRRPIDAGVHFQITEDRVLAETEAGPHDAGDDRLAHQEFLRALAGVIVVVDGAVVVRLIAVIFFDLSAHRERGIEHFALGVGGRLVFPGVEHLE